jgi:NAD(P) transhydrogenase
VSSPGARGECVERFDVVVVGGGPAGQKAAVQGAKAGKRVLIVEEARAVGGECVHRGTIPSKTLRETADSLAAFRRRSGGVYEITAPEEVRVASLLTRLKSVVAAHQVTTADQMARNGIAVAHGRARFVSPHDLEVRALDGTRCIVRGEIIVLATGSRPRRPAHVPVDHENILDSDSILSLSYLPRSLAVLGAGVIASEYASVFAALGVAVTMIDGAPRPLAFLDPELTATFVHAFERAGGRFQPGRTARRLVVDAPFGVRVELDDGTSVVADKVLCALGRQPNVAGLGLEVAGVRLSPRGYVEVDADGRTVVPHVFAAGDLVGPPALAATAMEQGRRAVCAALGLPSGATSEIIPVGIYTIPEMSSVGLSEAQARERFGGNVLVGRARFAELARGLITGSDGGLLKLVADGAGRVLGVHVVGESATELVHVGQMAIIAGMTVDVFIDHVFNFPTLAEGYRVAALDIRKQRGYVASVPASVPASAA